MRNLSEACAYSKGTVAAEFLPDGMTLDCYSSGDTWNGFDCPAFELSEGLKMAAVTNGLVYDGSKDAFVFTPNAADSEEPAIEIYAGTDIVAAGRHVHVYFIGAYAWVWERVKIEEYRPIIDWDDPVARFNLIEEKGPDVYNQLIQEHFERSAVSCINGYKIRPVSSRFGRLFQIMGTTTAYPNLPAAEAAAKNLPPAAA